MHLKNDLYLFFLQILSVQRTLKAAELQNICRKTIKRKNKGA